MPPVAPTQQEKINHDVIHDTLQKIWKLKYPECYGEFVMGEMLGKDSTKASITHILFILFNKLDEIFTQSIETNTEIDIKSKKIIQTLYSNQKDALKRILSIYGNDNIHVDTSKIVAFLSGYISQLVNNTTVFKK